jgi:hypothetical protein
MYQTAALLAVFLPNLRRMFDGNSNWIRVRLQYYFTMATVFKIECPTGAGEVAHQITNQLIRIFRAINRTADWCSSGPRVPERSVLARSFIILRVFPGDNAAGIGASHQTG